MRLPQFRIGTMMGLVLIVALAAALVVQHQRAERRIAWLQAEVSRLKGYSQWSGHGRATVVGDKIAIAFMPRIFEREPGGKYRWRFELSDRKTGKVLLSKPYDQVVPVREGSFHSALYTDLIDCPLEPGEYRVRFVLITYTGHGPKGQQWRQGPGNAFPLVVEASESVDRDDEPSPRTSEGP